MTRAAQRTDGARRQPGTRGLRSGLVLALALAACGGGNEMELRPVGASSDDHGYADLIAAIEEQSKQPTSPTHYRDFVERVQVLSPRFNEEMREIAELYTAFRALPVIEAHLDRPRSEQLGLLAKTVFPTAFGLEPNDDESVDGYLQRLCGVEDPLSCKQYVPEGWPVVMSARARRSLKHRAQEALDGCGLCPDEASHRAYLEKFSKLAAKEDAYAARVDRRFRTDRWPVTGQNGGEPWAGYPLFALVGDGKAVFGDEELAPGKWAEPLAARRGDAKTLGVHLLPDTKVQTLRVLAADAAAAGFTQIALQARRSEYPYEIRQYAISLGRKGARVDVRDIDSVQILVRALDLNKSPAPRL